MEQWKWIAEREATEILADDELEVETDDELEVETDDELEVETDDELEVETDSSETDIHSMEVETKDCSSAV